jgi:glycosyltransferase involved in cell wall biosynthesis
MPTTVIFFLHCSRISPSSKRRALDYAPYLKQAGINPHWVSYTPANLYAKFHILSIRGGSIGIRFVNYSLHLLLGGLIVFLRWVSLAKLLILCKQAEAVFIQKVTPPTWCTSMLKVLNPNIAFDFDDALFLRRKKRTEAIIRASRVVFAGSRYNYQFAMKLNHSVVLLPTPVPVERFRAKTDFAWKQTVIGWIGSASTLEALSLLPGVLEKLAEKHPDVVFRIIGYGKHAARLPCFRKISVELVPRIPYEEVPEAIRAFDIGVMPLLGSDWDRGKCAGKALEYMAAGVPALASRFGENEYVIQDGRNGFLASDEKEWLSKLEALVKDPALRKRIGEAGRTTILESFSTKKCADILIDNLSKHLPQAA